MFVHFKCNYDPTWDYESICKDFFRENKCMAMAEKMMTNSHVHFQGETDMTPVEFEKALTKLAATHYSKKTNPSGRPLKRAKREVDDVGYQYLSKEGKAPIYCQGFSAEDLEVLKGASDAHVDELKNGMPDHLNGLSFSGDPAQVYSEMRWKALEYYAESDRRPGPRFQKDVLWVMYKHPGTCDGWKRFVADRI